MKLREWSRKFRISRQEACITAIVVMVCILTLEHLSKSRLDAKVARLQEGQAALLRERASIKQISDLWKAEAIEWREKNGYVEPPSVPPTVNDDDREIILPPDAPRP